ncbi:MAG: hypothetical protein ACRDDJ_08750 [[Mycobacterium] stephanolepidis]
MNTSETITLSPDTRFRLREILRSIPGSHEQWAAIQDVLDTSTVDADELLNTLAAIAAAVRTIVTVADRDLAQLRRERDTVRTCPRATRTANTGRAQQIQALTGTHPASTNTAAQENTR